LPVPVTTNIGLDTIRRLDTIMLLTLLQFLFTPHSMGIYFNLFVSLNFYMCYIVKCRIGHVIIKHVE